MLPAPGGEPPVRRWPLPTGTLHVTLVFFVLFSHARALFSHARALPCSHLVCPHVLARMTLLPSWTGTTTWVGIHEVKPLLPWVALGAHRLALTVNLSEGSLLRHGPWKINFTAMAG